MDAWDSVETPAIVYDERKLVECAGVARTIAASSGCQLLYSLKPCILPSVMTLLGNYVEGFSASSLFELQLAKEISPHSATTHMTAPAFSPMDMRLMGNTCDYVSFNSITQYERFVTVASKRPFCGLRVNPACSFVRDERYDPCRKHSKLGIPIVELSRLFESSSPAIAGITGIHFHNNCDSEDFGELFATAGKIVRELGGFLRQLSWINLGGGYLFDQAISSDLFAKTVTMFRELGLKVFAEPGAALVGKAGYLVATVLDMLERDGTLIAILDTTVNHAPEVFEYQFEPEVIGHRDDGPFQVLLAGCSCLAGDLFGRYAFDHPIGVGSRIVFAHMGAYTTTKWHMFNGINLPRIYTLTEEGNFVLRKSFTYEDFALRCGVDKYAAV